MDELEKIAQLEATLHSKYYCRKYGYHPWGKLPPTMKAEIYENADQFLGLMGELGYRKPPKEKRPFSVGCGGDS